MAEPVLSERVSTGIDGLDRILRGGLPKERIFLLYGGPGTGKTTLGLQFLLEGVRRSERVMYVTLLQSKTELIDIVASHNWSLDGIDVVELPDHVQDTASSEQTLFSPTDIELPEATNAILRAIEQRHPQRLVLDSLSELSVLMDNSFQLRRQILRLKRTLMRERCTALLTAGDASEEDIMTMQTIVYGVIHLDREAPAYGRPRRRVSISKMRGMDFAGGYHDFRIRTGGIDIYPRIELVGRPRTAAWHVIASGNGELDAMLGGGLEEGTACLLAGTTGAGKSTLAGLYVQAAAERGERSTIYCFDERPETFIRRADGIGMSIGRQIERGLVDLNQVNVGELSPGEFMHTVRSACHDDGVRLVVIDSLTGYLNAVPDDRTMMIQLHELLSYLSAAGVLTIMIVTAHGLSGSTDRAAIDASYLADTVVVVRHFEANGAMRRCIAVAKKRHGPHESTIRELRIDDKGVTVGQPLANFSGVLTGSPHYTGRYEELLASGGVEKARPR